MNLKHIIVRIFKLLSSFKVLAFFVIVLQIGILYILVNPAALLGSFSSSQIVAKVSQLTDLPSEIPTVGSIGDNKFLPDIQALKDHSEIENAVYKDALNGDYVIVYSNKMIIFRDSENRIVYEGDTPTHILEVKQQENYKELISTAKESGIISFENMETPLLRTVITEADELKNSKSEVFKDIKTGDIVAVFLSEGKTVIYRPVDGRIVNYGNLVIETEK